MSQFSTSRWPSLKKWTPLAFVVAAVARVGNEVITHLGSALGTPAPELVTDLTITLAFGVALIGLLGIYSWVVDLSPRLSRAGLLAVGITAASIILSLIGKYLVGGEGPQGILLVIPLSFYIFSAVSFLAFAIISLRMSVPSRTVGYLLLAVFASRVVTVAGQVEIGAVLFVLPLLGIGYILRGKISHPEVEVSTEESVA